jgi:hypothetical protein
MKNIITICLITFLSGCNLFLPNDLKRFYSLENLIKEKYFNNQLHEAQELSNEYLLLARKYPKDWNYGNAIQKANTYLGLIALEYGYIDAAKAHLIASGNTPGSPQLDTFGPNMLLAKALLDHNHINVVLEYLDQLKIFWEMEDGKIDHWKNQIDKGESPDFGANLMY